MTSEIYISQQWQTFGAGIFIILLSIFLFSVNGILSLFRIKSRIPLIIPWIIFAIGVGVILDSFGSFSIIKYYLAYGTQYTNISETIIGLLIILLAIYTKPSGSTRTMMLVGGSILVLDGTNILPIIKGIKDYINSVAFYLGSYVLMNPSVVLEYTVLVLLGIGIVGILIFKFRKVLGGVL